MFSKTYVLSNSQVTESPTVLALNQGLLNIVIFAVFALVDLRPRKQELLDLKFSSPSPW